MIRTALTRTLAVLLSLGIGFGIAEIAVRLLPSTPPAEDKRIETRYRGKFTTAELRDRGMPGPKAPGTFRILAVGDSFTWGAGVPSQDAYPDVLEVLLNENGSEVAFEVVNWSRPGWATLDAWQNLRTRLDGLEPDLLLIGFVLNDSEPRARRKKNEIRVGLERRAPEHPTSRFLHEHSALYHLLWERIENTRQRRAFSTYYERLFEGEHWERCQKALRNLHHRAATRGIPSVLVIFPVFDSPLDGRYAYRDQHSLVAETAQTLGFRTLDLLDKYEGVEAHELALHPFTDSHPSTLAHRISAERIREFLESEDLLP